MGTQGILNNLTVLSILALLIPGCLFLLIYLWRFQQDRRKARSLKHEFESYEVQIDGVRIHYLAAGAGPPIVLLHGIGASVFTWRLLMPLLARHFKVIAVDLPGFGRSEKNPNRSHSLDEQAEVIHSFTKALKLKRPVLVGSSMGGSLALWMSKIFPSDYLKVATIAPAASPQLMPLELARLYKFFHPSTSLLLNKVFFKTVIKRAIGRSELVTEEVIRQYQRPYIEEPMSIRTFLRATSILSDKRLPHELASIKAQVIILYGANDRLVPKAVMQQLRKVLPHALYEEHSRAGHHPMEDEPQWVYEKLCQFLDVKIHDSPTIRQSPTS